MSKCRFPVKLRAQLHWVTSSCLAGSSRSIDSSWNVQPEGAAFNISADVFLRRRSGNPERAFL
ncbi:hypothetical protein M514_03668 [Trichuris suis]|uniref:Uncharacterized protein n=1 Tax=Trichuris suis TaxID=68888 RepID=A0A085NGQ0_9BILA|nr:hypothetical protein M513_03668 [Trichuris suis]KFD68646.1 hypothetical protein M514_03668 [Trichuris suis]